jgi:hypothetical protein
MAYQRIVFRQYGPLRNSPSVERKMKSGRDRSTAKEIIEVERKKHGDKTAKLREARLAKEAAHLLAQPPGKAARGRATKAK